MEVFSKRLVDFIRTIYSTNDYIPLHSPSFNDKDKEYVLDAIDSTFVSTVGNYVTSFEDKVAKFTGMKYAIATVNGTSALHVALLSSGVRRHDEVITQSLTFIATCNAISYCGADPVFIDVDRKTMGLSPESLLEFLTDYAEIREDGLCWNKKTQRVIRACVPVHCLGHPVEIDKIQKLCALYNIKLIEDSAESLGSFYKGKHTGSFGESSVISFNGNKIITCGGGGMVITNDREIAERVKHMTTTAKNTHSWLFSHDEIGYNYRLPNINAALGCAQIEKLDSYIVYKRQLANQYQEWFLNNDRNFVLEPSNCESNYWFNAFLSRDKFERDYILEYTNNEGVMTRPLWTPMHNLPMFSTCLKTSMTNTDWLYEHVVCIPSSVSL